MNWHQQFSPDPLDNLRDSIATILSDKKLGYWSRVDELQELFEKKLAELQENND